MYSEQVAVDRDKTITTAKENLNFLAALALEDIFKFCYPPIFIAIWQILTTAIEATRGKTNLAIGIPRGFGKTIILKLYVLYVILFTDRKFILVVCNTAALAENFIADVFDMLSSDNIVGIFGNWRHAEEKNTLNLKKFNFRGRSIIVAAAGAKSSLRGLNIKFVRPDCIIMDDMQSREEAESAIESMKSLTWMLGTLMKAAAPERCLYVFVGNMYPFEGSILKKLKYNPAWTSFICGAILEDGQSLWPELKPVEELITELENDTSMGHPEIFYSEVMNDEEAGTRSGIDISLILGVPVRDLPEYPEAGFIIIDPSLGKKKSDDVAIGAVLVYDRVPILRELLVGKFSQSEIIRKSLQLALKYGLPAIVIEGNAFQATLQFWFQHFIAQLGITGITPLLIYGNAHKNSRILAMFKELLAKKVQLCETVRSQVIYQITHFNPLKTNNKDDILDVVAYILPVMAQHSQFILLGMLVGNQEGQDDSSETSDALLLPF